MLYKKPIIITTINHPTEAVGQYANDKDLDVLIVPDKKTPGDWMYPNTTLLSDDRLYEKQKT